MLFKKDYLDPFYIKRRENTILLGLSCNTPDVNCFCTTFEDGKMHVDALFTDIGDKYLIEVSSEKGKEITEKLSLAKKEEKKITKAKIIDIKGITEKLDEIFNSDLWKKIAMKCLGCGICTYLCPTCHCFDIQDESTLTNGARLRIWDSCMREEYTLQASGYNPRPLRMDRMKNRIYHKFNYFPKNFNVFACVGCGRCIDNCPVNTNIIDVIDSIKKEGG
jgi:ferredoxin